jgi:F-type H+-transporting ATPase subunit delta
MNADGGHADFAHHPPSGIIKREIKMADAITIARPYAKALFAEALAHQLLGPWAQALNLLTNVVQDAQVAQLILSPQLSDKELQTFFIEVINTLDKTVCTTLGQRLDNLLRLLTEEKRLALLPSIARLYHQLQIQHQGVIEAEVIAAFPLSEDHREQIQLKLEKRFNSKVSLNVSKDESLIGGAIVRVGNWVMDGSVKGKLAKLTLSLPR